MIKYFHLFRLNVALPAEGLYLLLGHAAPQSVFVVPIVRRRQVGELDVNLHGIFRGIVAHLSLLFSTFGHVALACKWNKSPRSNVATLQEAGQ